MRARKWGKGLFVLWVCAWGGRVDKGEDLGTRETEGWRGGTAAGEKWHYMCVLVGSGFLVSIVDLLVAQFPKLLSLPG